MLGPTDRDARYAIIRDAIADYVESECKRSKLHKDDAQLADVQARAITDVVLSLIDALHVIAEAQQASAQNYAP